MLTMVYMEKMYSTAEVAKYVGVHKRTILRWLYAKEIPEPRYVMGTSPDRIWSQEEMEAAKAYKELNYRKRS